MKMVQYTSSKKLQIKINPDNTTDNNSLKYKASIIWNVMQFKCYHSFGFPKVNFVVSA